MTPQVLMNTPPAPFNQTHSTKRTTLDFPGYTTTKYDLSQGTHANDGLLEHARIGYFGSRHRFIGWNDDHEAEDISHHQTETPQNVSAFCWRGPGVMEKSEVSKALLHTILYIYIYIYIYMHVTITVFTYLFIQEIVYSFINLIKNLSVNVHLFIQLIFICLSFIHWWYVHIQRSWNIWKKKHTKNILSLHQLDSTWTRFPSLWPGTVHRKDWCQNEAQTSQVGWHRGIWLMKVYLVLADRG